MTNEARAGAPRTEAGRALLSAGMAFDTPRGRWRVEDGRVEVIRETIRAIEKEAAAAPSFDVERLRQSWWNLVVAPPRDDVQRWEPDRYNAGHFLQAVMVEYTRLSEAAPPVAPLGETDR